MSTKKRPEDTKNEQDNHKDAQKNINSKENDTEQSTETIDKWLDNYSTENKKPNHSDKNQTETKETKENSTSIKKEQTSLHAPQDSKKMQFLQQIPNWVEKPWMYVKPTHSDHLSSWLESWTEVILDYARIHKKHIINILELQDIHPFNHKQNKKNLTVEQLRSIIEEMNDQDLAKWIEEGIIARIYYKSDKEWADIIYQYLLDTGMAAEILTLFELKQLDEVWSKLPQEELRNIIEILINDKKAKWVDDERSTIKFNY